MTDAALAVGLVDPEAFDPPLDVGRVDLPGEAQEFLEIARESMAAAVRRLATARGIDLEDHALVAYGGAAGQHAAAVAEKLGIQAVLVHPCAGVLCAWGQSLARREAADVLPIWQNLDTAWPAVESAWSALQGELPPAGRVGGHGGVETRRHGSCGGGGGSDGGRSPGSICQGAPPQVWV